jgi:gluconate 2-dehydrogenase gamma chain
MSNKQHDAKRPADAAAGKSGLLQIEEIDVSRRSFFHGLGVAAVLSAGSASLEAQQHAHHAVSEEKKDNGTYTARFFNAHEMATARRLAELVIPADERGPSAADVGAHEFIDLICSKAPEIAMAWTGGLQWLDGVSVRRTGAKFVSANESQQNELLELIAYRKNLTSELAPGIEFFTLVRRMIVDGYFTTREGFKDVGFLGNRGTMKWDVPAESLNYVMERAPNP